jgi:triacylglycerol lipase
MISDSRAAAHALLVSYAQTAFDADPKNLAPALDPRAAALELVGHIVGRDAVSFEINQRVCYGFLARSTVDPDLHVAVVRGTASAVEWLKDAEFAMKAHPVAGEISTGMWDVYDELRLVVRGVASPLIAGVAQSVGAGKLTVVGHSLGAALATFFAFDAAYPLGDRLDAIILASPHPGDAAFAAAFEAQVQRYVLYNYEHDRVPQVPVGFRYKHLAQECVIRAAEAQAKIRDSLWSNHHVTSYAAMLDYQTVADWSALDTDHSILGPNQQ